MVVWLRVGDFSPHMRLGVGSVDLVFFQRIQNRLLVMKYDSMTPPAFTYISSIRPCLLRRIRSRLKMAHPQIKLKIFIKCRLYAEIRYYTISADFLPGKQICVILICVDIYYRLRMVWSAVCLSCAWFGLSFLVLLEHDGFLSAASFYYHSNKQTNGRRHR